MQVHAAHGVIQIEEPTTWQCLAPQELVVLPKSGAVRVRVLSGRVSPEVKRGIDQHASPVYRRREAIWRSLFAIGSGASLLRVDSNGVGADSKHEVRAPSARCRTAAASLKERSLVERLHRLAARRRFPCGRYPIALAFRLYARARHIVHAEIRSPSGRSPSRRNCCQSTRPSRRSPRLSKTRSLFDYLFGPLGISYSKRASARFSSSSLSCSDAILERSAAFACSRAGSTPGTRVRSSRSSSCSRDSSFVARDPLQPEGYTSRRTISARAAAGSGAPERSLYASSVHSYREGSPAFV